MKAPRLVSIFALGMVLALLLVACGGKSEPAVTNTPTGPTATTRPATTSAPTATARPQPRTGGILKLAVISEPGKLDAQLEASGPVDAYVNPFLNFTLLNTAEGLQPDLAQRWSVSQDGKKLTFNLTTGAAWHDGRPVTADDMVYSMNRMATEGQIKASFLPMQAVSKVDDATFQIDLKAPSISFISILGIIRAPIYPKHVAPEDFASKTAGKVIGSGPYKFKEYSRGVQLLHEKNTKYWKKDAAGNPLPYLDGVQVFIVPDGAARYSMYRTGQVDIITDSSTLGGKEGQVEKDVPGTVLHITTGGPRALVFNVQRKPYDDVRVRRAISLALNRQAMTQLISDGLGTPYMGFLIPGSEYAQPESEIKSWPGYNPATKDKDIAEAKRLLAEAGVDPAKLTEKILSLSAYQTWSEAVAGDLRKSLGVNLGVDAPERATAVERATARDYALYVAPYGGLILDPFGDLDSFLRTGSRLNHHNASDPTVDQRLNQLDTLQDKAARVQLARQLEKEIILDKVWRANLTSGLGATAWRSYVNGHVPAFGNDPRTTQFTTIWLAPH